MIKVHDRVYIGSEAVCRTGDNQWAVVHACKSPCHQNAVGYRKNLPRTHPNYLVLGKDNDLYINMIDPSKPLFMPNLFTDFLAFAEKHWNAGQNILIHCNLGESRAPSLAMLFLAKRLKIIPDADYYSAKTEFISIVPNYNPGIGIQTYLQQNWTQL